MATKRSSIYIYHYFSYNIGLFVQDLLKKKFALASRPKEENSKIDKELPNTHRNRGKPTVRRAGNVVRK